MRLNHLFPLTPFCRASSIFSVHTPCLALCLIHMSSSPCLSVAGTDGEIASRRPSFEASAFLPPLAPPALPGFNATTAALTPVRELAPSCPDRSAVFTVRPLPDIPSPITLTSPITPSESRGVWMPLLCAASWLRPMEAGSPVGSGRIVFICITVCLILSIAFHPASRRRSYFKFSDGHRHRLAGVFHSGGLYCSTAHLQSGCAARWWESWDREGAGVLAGSRDRGVPVEQ
jgi:hypothetical protein